MSQNRTSPALRAPKKQIWFVLVYVLKEERKAPAYSKERGGSNRVRVEAGIRVHATSTAG
jgi:hypothetical protein